MKPTLLFITPHLSTGGMPQYLFKQIEELIDDYTIYCVEWNNITGGKLVVQRNKIANLLKDNLITLPENKEEVFSIIKKINPQIIHLHESPELFMSDEIAIKLYDSNRSYILVETSHDSTYNVQTKQYLPDKFLLVSQHQVNRYTQLNIPCELIPYPIEQHTRTKSREQVLLELGLDPNVKHVVNVGLFTPNKNQSEIIEYARMLQNYPIQFHFIGNQAENFKSYWEPLMKQFPSNCKWWNERTDVDTFYEMADLFLFTSKYETMPLVVLEALGWNVPSLIYNLPSYSGEFDKYDTIDYLTTNLEENIQKILTKLSLTELTNISIKIPTKNEKMSLLLDTTPCPHKRDLASLANKLFPNGKGVEIGVLRGDYSKMILERWHNGTMYLIDTWRHISSYIDMNGQDDKYHYDCMVKVCENIKPWQHRAHMIRMDSVTSADIFPDEYFDFIYIDADHAYDAIVRDLKAWWPKIKKGGLFCGDDYIPDNGDIWLIDGDKKTYAGKFGVRQAVDEFAVQHNVKIYSTIEEQYWKQWYTFKPF